MAPDDTIITTTPTGHHYHSEPPRAPGHQEHTLEDDVQNHLDDQDDGIGAADEVA